MIPGKTAYLSWIQGAINKFGEAISMVKREVLTKLIDAKKAAILRILLNSPEELCLKEIAGKSLVPMTSTFRILHELGGMEIVKRREWKTSKVYSCFENEKVDFLRELFHEEFDGVREFVEKIKEFYGIQRILLQSKSQSRANLLLIGEGINANRVEETCEEIRKRGFDVQFLSLVQPQYEQMVRMGLYSGKEKVLK